MTWRYWRSFLARVRAGLGLEPRIIRHDDDPMYRSLRRAAYKAYPEDPAARLVVFQALGTPQQVLLALCELVQQQAHHLLLVEAEPFHVSSFEVDLLWRALLVLTRHLQNDLPDGLYAYLLENLEAFGASVLGRAAAECRDQPEHEGAPAACALGDVTRHDR